jgi:hypothetical protein
LPKFLFFKSCDGIFNNHDSSSVFLAKKKQNFNSL